MGRHARYALAWLLFIGALTASVALLGQRSTPQAEAVVYPTSHLVPVSEVITYDRWSFPSMKGLGATMTTDAAGAVHIVARSANPLDATANANAIADSYAGALNANGARVGSFAVQLAGLPDNGIVRRLLWVVGLAGGATVCGVYLVRGAAGPRPRSWRLRPGAAI